MAMELYADQAGALAQLRDAYAEGHRRIMLQLPTGAGKTIIAAAMTAKAHGKSKRVLFTVPFLELVDQTQERFAANDIHEVGIIQAKHRDTDSAKPIQIASVPTLLKHWKNGNPPGDIAIVDEAHRWFQFYKRWFEHEEWKDKPIIGLSATPWTRGLGKFYTKLIVPTTLGDLIKMGRLSPFRVYAPSHPKLDHIKLTAGDFNEGELSEEMRKPDIVGDVVETWKAKGEGKPTLVFAVDTAHAIKLEEEFIAAGIPAGRLSAESDSIERRSIRRRFHSGDLKVVINVGVLTQGADWDVRCLVIARPTKSEILHVQIVGRALRVAPGKDDALILDHSDNHLRLGFVTEIQHAALKTGQEPKASKLEGEQRQQGPRECFKCKFLMVASARVCPACGHEAPPPLCTVRNGKGELVQMDEQSFIELQQRMKAAGKAYRKGIEEHPRVVFAQFRWVGLEHGYKSGWAAVQYRERYGEWPPRAWNGDIMLTPTSGVLSWIQSRRIAYAKSKQRADSRPPVDAILRDR